MTTFASIYDIATSWDLYQRSLADVASPPPEGLILHLAGPTDEGVRVVSVWLSEQAAERFWRDRVGPAIAAMARPVRPVWTVRGFYVAHVALGGASATLIDQENPSC